MTKCRNATIFVSCGSANILDRSEHLGILLFFEVTAMNSGENLADFLFTQSMKIKTLQFGGLVLFLGLN